MKRYDSIPDFYGFIRAMEMYGMFHSLGYAIEFLEKPYKWSREFTLWENAGCPYSEDDPGWEGFVVAMDKLVMA